MSAESLEEALRLAAERIVKLERAVKAADKFVATFSRMNWLPWEAGALHSISPHVDELERELRSAR